MKCNYTTIPIETFLAEVQRWCYKTDSAFRLVLHRAKLKHLMDSCKKRPDNVTQKAIEKFEEIKRKYPDGVRKIYKTSYSRRSVTVNTPIMASDGIKNNGLKKLLTEEQIDRLYKIKSEGGY